MRKLFILLILSSLTLSVSATECTDYLTKIYKQEYGAKVRIKSKSEHTNIYNQMLGENYISAIVYGTGYLKRPKFRKSNITYECTIDDNNKPVWGEIFFQSSINKK